MKFYKKIFKGNIENNHIKSRGIYNNTLALRHNYYRKEKVHQQSKEKHMNTKPNN